MRLVISVARLSLGRNDVGSAGHRCRSSEMDISCINYKISVAKSVVH